MQHTIQKTWWLYSFLFSPYFHLVIHTFLTTLATSVYEGADLSPQTALLLWTTNPSLKYMCGGVICSLQKIALREDYIEVSVPRTGIDRETLFLSIFCSRRKKKTNVVSCNIYNFSSQSQTYFKEGGLEHWGDQKCTCVP